MARTMWAIFSIVGIIAFSGCSSTYHHGMDGSKSESYWEKGRQDMADLIDRTVKDQGKAQQAKTITNSIIAELKANSQHERDFHRQLYQLNANYQAAPEDFMKIIDEANNQRMRSASKVLGLRFQMKELMTAEEWKALTDQLAAYSGRYRHGAEMQKTL